MTSKLEKILEGLGGERRINYSLDRFRAALKSLGNPEQKVPTLLIAGTNGKGTSTLFVSSALKESGLRTVTYLSPHLQNPNERILTDLRCTDSDSIDHLAESLESTAKRFDLSYFELMTLITFVWAAETRADYLILEVGLGGRLDATNVTRPQAVLLTNVSFDHQQYLGNTLEEILAEKLAVVPAGGRLFTGIREPDLIRRVEARCRELGADCHFSHSIQTEPRDVHWQGQEVLIDGDLFSLTNPTPGARLNAALALLMLRSVFPEIQLTTIQRGFARVVNPGRMEQVAENPRVILSGDHNPAGIECLLQTLEVLAPRKLRILCGFSPDKPYSEMYRSLASLTPDILLTQIARLKDKMPDDYQGLGPFMPDAREALRKCLAASGPDETLLITGSLYLVGELRAEWRSKVEFLTNP